jgi:hypothetical protein
MTASSDNYFTDVEDHFRRVRGTGMFLLSSTDWALVKSWKDAGIPLEAVLRGIDATFEKWRRRPAQARIQMINSISYCAQAIAAEAQVIAERPPLVREDSTPAFALEDVRTFVGRNVAMLKKTGHHDVAASLEELDLAALYSDPEQLDKSLTAIEEGMIARVRSTVNEELLSKVLHTIDADLELYRGKMSKGQLAVLEKQLLDRRLLESTGLPRLSLFYLL